MIQTLSLLAVMVSGVVPSAVCAAEQAVVAILHTYEARIRFDGKVSTTQVKASDAGHARKPVQARFVPSVTVLGVKRVDEVWRP